MSDAADPQPVNHHAAHPGFSGVLGSLFALVLLFTGRAGARLAADLTHPGPHDHVLDVGCGSGAAARLASRSGAQVTGIDPSASMLRIARAAGRRRGTVEWIEGSAEALPVADGSATIVWALATVHHWRDVDTALAELCRVLAPGGRMLALERQVQPGATGLGSHGWTRAQADSFATLCRAAGLVDVGVTDTRAAGRAVWVVQAQRSA